MTYKITFHIDTGNAAFDECVSVEVARIIRQAIGILNHRGTRLESLNGAPLRDLNGNTVGEVVVRRGRKPKGGGR